jgi:uncharacterized protein GlcG (DUF336 family)
MSLTLDVAEKMVQAAKAKATDMGCILSVAVVDSGGFLITGSRMDDSGPLNLKIAEDMAFTAAMFKAPGQEVMPFASEPWFQSMVTRMQGRLVPADGLLPITIGGEVVGGIGAAGASDQQDLDVCQAALNALANNFR